VFEAMNLATVWKLPVIFVFENNGYAEATPQPLLGVLQGHRRARHRLRHARPIVDGMISSPCTKLRRGDRSGRATAAARRSSNTSSIATSATSKATTRTTARRRSARLREETCCIKRFARKVTGEHGITAQQLAAIDERSRAAHRRGRGLRRQTSPEPEASDLLTDVYIKY
jgi:TPP-dependent pyruvate/acetoin dehydrogenase alpha subunit